MNTCKILLTIRMLWTTIFKNCTFKSNKTMTEETTAHTHVRAHVSAIAARQKWWKNKRDQSCYSYYIKMGNHFEPLLRIGQCLTKRRVLVRIHLRMERLSQRAAAGLSVDPTPPCTWHHHVSRLLGVLLDTSPYLCAVAYVSNNASWLTMYPKYCQRLMTVKLK